MPYAPTDAVVAGSKAFALALFAPLTERAAARPRVAADPAQAQALCQGCTGILVLEYDARWLPVLRQLRREEAGLRIVAALPRGMEAAALHLGPLGVEAVPWDGQAATVMPAVERLLAAAPSAPAPAPVKAVPAAAPAAPRPPAPAAVRPV
ncbi:MAG TPA: hypothetical protein VFP50_20335, partial [Anaeromyxobacteraceae bacterium]|nr:hypothetical protein [Anaeromyxobacteraceae bacterium]